MRTYTKILLCKNIISLYDNSNSARFEVNDMQHSEIWSISAERISSFFASQDDVRQEGPRHYACGQCEVFIEVLPFHMVGRFHLPQTRVTFNGPDEDSGRLYHRFFLQFISAGG